jgi:hypothetical protein
MYEEGFSCEGRKRLRNIFNTEKKKCTKGMKRDLKVLIVQREEKIVVCDGTWKVIEKVNWIEWALHRTGQKKLLKIDEKYSLFSLVKNTHTRAYLNEK